MVDVDLGDGLGVRRRRRRSAMERRRVVEETLEAGASVARVALKYGVNANQVFQWRRLYRDGRLGAGPDGAMELLPVIVGDDAEPAKLEATEVSSSGCGAIRIELAGEVRVSLDVVGDPPGVGRGL